MFTYLIYSFILFGSTFSAYMSQKAQNSTLRGVFYFLTFFIPFIFLAIRYEINYDYHNYVYYFYQIADGNIPNKGWLYILINLFVAKLGLDVQWIFVIFAFFTLYFTYKTFEKDIATFAIFLFIALFYLYDGMDIIRQGLAISIMAYATKYIKQNSFFKYTFWAVIAMGIHLSSGLIMLILYPILNIKFNRVTLISIVLIIYLLVLKFDLIDKILEFVTSNFSQYSWYATNERFMQEKEVGSGLGIIFKMAMLFIVVWYKDKIINNYPRANIFINIYVIYFILMIFSLKIVIFERVQNIFIFGVILSLAYFLSTLESKSRVLFTAIIFSFYGMDYYKYIASKTIENMESGKNLAVVNPYRTIFEREEKRVDNLRDGWKKKE